MNVANVVFHAHVSHVSITSCHLDSFQIALSSHSSPHENSGCFSSGVVGLLNTFSKSSFTTFFSSSSGWCFFKSFASSFQSTTPYHFSHCIHVGHHLSELPINQFLSIQQPVLLLFTYICSVHAVFFLNVILSQFTRPVQLNSSSIVLLSSSLALVQKSSFSFRFLFSCSLCLTTHGLVSV